MCAHLAAHRQWWRRLIATRAVRASPVEICARVGVETLLLLSAKSLLREEGGRKTDFRRLGRSSMSGLGAPPRLAISSSTQPLSTRPGHRTPFPGLSSEQRCQSSTRRTQTHVTSRAAGHTHPSQFAPRHKPCSIRLSKQANILPMNRRDIPMLAPQFIPSAQAAFIAGFRGQRLSASKTLRHFVDDDVFNDTQQPVLGSQVDPCPVRR